MENLDLIWEETVAQLKDNLPPLHKRALESISPVKEENNVITLSISSKLMLDNIKKQQKTIENTISEKSGTEYKVEFIVDTEKKNSKPAAVKEEKKEVPTKSIKTSKNNTLNPKYTFDNFISGDNSILPYQAAKLEALNSITHPWMVERTLELCREAEKEGKTAIINAALLESMGFVEYCDVIILVYAPYDVRLKRALRRDNITEENFRKRSESQSDIGLLALSSDKKVITIMNNTTEEQLSRQVELCCVNIKLN